MKIHSKMKINAKQKNTKPFEGHDLIFEVIIFLLGCIVMSLYYNVLFALL